MRILAINSVGEDVKEVQKTLNKLINSSLKEDGIFGAFTRAAVIRFQAQNNIVADGVVGFNTYNILGLLKESAPEWLVLHCSATPEKIAGHNAKAIVNFHVNILRWGRPGYARIIEYDGSVIETWKVDTSDGIQPFEATFGVGNFGRGKGVDAKALNVCYVGGLDAAMRIKDTRTPLQLQSLEKVCKDLIKMHKNIKIAGHNQFQNKACPSFWTPNWLESIGVPEKNIYRTDPFGYSKILK